MKKMFCPYCGDDDMRVFYDEETGDILLIKCVCGVTVISVEYTKKIEG